MWRRLKRLSRPARHRLAWLALKGLAAIIGALPLPALQACGRWTGRLVGVIAWGERRAMARRLDAAALTTRPSPGRCWADLGQRLFELMAWRRALPHVVVGPEAVAALRGALDEGRGLVAATCHLGHWELMAGALAREGFAVHSTAARRRSSPLHRWLDETRVALGVTTHTPGGGARGLMAVIRAGGASGVFIDQHTGERSVALPFLGRAAPTPLTCGRVVSRTGAALCLVWNVREGRGYRVHVRRLDVEGADPEEITRRLTATLEPIVGEHPAQWVWLHDRWGVGRP